MSKEAYVHEGVSLICTNGFRPAKLLVKDRGVRIAGGQLMATEEDKPTNFACKWAGVLAALIAAILIAAPFIVSVLAAFLIGMLAALSLGQLLCWVALQGGKWNMVHPRVKLKGQCALTENSRLTCALMGGDITIFYDEATASRALHNNWLRNSVEILGAAFMGRALGSSLITNGFLKGVQRVTFEVIKGSILSVPISIATDFCTDIMVGEEGALKQSFSVGDLSSDPIMVEEESKILQKEKNTEVRDRLDKYQENQAKEYKEKNPIHKYRRGKKSPHYNRQKTISQKRNSRAKKYAKSRRQTLSRRYQSRVCRQSLKSYTRIAWGQTAFFAIMTGVAEYFDKKMQIDLRDENNPENCTKKQTKIYACKK
ncbi:hypothetical protein PORCRE_1522 [Porphyromonas crevioricanis JCM 15906]|uniref:DUF4280 domain-containing protein n=1 Tax=Porphyromonas crevioricanis JCM 15906 TaxID=1305617 RepID=T1CRU8_9PORP|nr:PAAR-like protein [Porphyromonas crevioricanis]GAD05813.1 hypothetical protein PORCRE_1522 [Porphyromonas crevioricanis JCM 15906]SKA00625.1 protein of unknown function [Porphyromonas crevioricanis]